MDKKEWGYPLLRTRIRFEPDIVTVRQKTRKLTELLGFESQDQVRLATAVSELTRNCYQYANGGEVEFYLSLTEPQTLFIKVSDSGPGIQEWDSIQNGTYVSRSGMGVGLIGSKKLVDFFDIETSSAGTEVLLGKKLAGTLKSQKDLDQIIQTMVLKQAENPFEEIQNQNHDLLNALDELRKSKEELSQLNLELAETNRGVVALYAELDEKASSLQKANEIKTSFLSNMTHEFRTPLSSIISLTRLLLQRVDGDLTFEQEKQVSYIQKSSESLLELVNDLLDLAKVEAGKVVVQTTDFTLSELLGSLRGMFRPILGAESSVDFRVEWEGEDCSLHTDQAKVAQILRNLISNAIKFTEKGSILVTAQCLSSGLVQFKIQDSGIGIEPQYLKTIFDDFSQVPSTLQKKLKGTGLGLPLSRKLARILGGDLSVQSKPGEGSTFFVHLPITYGGHGEGQLVESSRNQSALEPSDQTQFKILIVDDDEPSRYVLKNLVKAELSAEFFEFDNARAGLSFMKECRPDLVFLDLTMPEMDGFSFMQSVQENKDLSSIPIIVNTAKKLSAQETEAVQSGAVSLLSKERTDPAKAQRDLRRALVKAGFDYKSM